MSLLTRNYLISRVMSGVLPKESLSKGKELPIGTIRQWGELRMQKIGQGSWKELAPQPIPKQAISGDTPTVKVAVPSSGTPSVKPSTVGPVVESPSSAKAAPAKMETHYEGSVGTAKRVREILKKEFPGTKFTVRSEKYAGGSSVRVDWVDGPLTRAVEGKVKWLEGADFDPMTDLKTYRDVAITEPDGTQIRVHGADYISCQRRWSPEREKLLESLVVKKYGEAGAKEQLGSYRSWEILAEAERDMMAGITE